MFFDMFNVSLSDAISTSNWENSAEAYQITVPNGIKSAIIVTHDTSGSVDLLKNVTGCKTLFRSDQSVYSIELTDGQVITVSSYSNSGTIYWY